MRHSIASLLTVAIATLLTFVTTEGHSAVCSVPGKPWVEGKTSRTVGIRIDGITPDGDATRAIKIFADGKVDYFTITGLPPGLTYRVFTPKDTSELNLCAEITGTPTRVGRYTLTVRAGNECGVSVPYSQVFDITPVGAEFACSYQGIVENSAKLNQGLGGLFQVTVSRLGTYTGKIWFGARPCVFSGALRSTTTDDVTGRSAFRCGTATMELEFVLYAADRSIQGSVLAADPKDYLPFRAVCSPYNTTTHRCPQAGTYTAALLQGDDKDKDVPHNGPQGIGYFGGTIYAHGAVAMAARLADNTVVSASTIIGSNQKFALHFPLYAGTGSCQGWLYADRGQLDGTMNWIKLPQPAASRTRSFKNGFNLHKLTAIGGLKPFPAAGSRWLGVIGNSPNSVLVFYYGGLTGVVEQPVTIQANHTATVAAGAVAIPYIDNANSLVRGTLTTQGRSAPFYAVFMPRLGKAVGHFQMPQSTSATSPILSGTVEFYNN